MKRTVALVAIALSAAAFVRGGASAAAPAARTDIGQGVMGPRGLSASVYATGLVNAAAFAFDAAGRLWVSTAAINDAVHDAVYVIDGPSRAPVKVIDGLHQALGLLWRDGEFYVSSRHGVMAYGGFDGARFAHVRPVFTLPPDAGYADGLIATTDGRIALAIAAPCNACATHSPYSPGVVSFRPDGTDVRVDVHGLRQPMSFAYYPGTSDLFVTMNQRDDLGAATPGDWLVPVRPGQDWRFPECYGQGGAGCEGVPAPTAVLDPHGVLTGLAIVTGQLGQDVGNAAIVAEWQMSKVMMVRLTKTSDGYRGRPAPFLTGIQNPVAVGLTPAGDVLVGSWTTGTIYRIAADKPHTPSTPPAQPARVRWFPDRTRYSDDANSRSAGAGVIVRMRTGGGV